MRLTDKVEILEQQPDGLDEMNEPVPGELISLGKFPAHVSYEMTDRVNGEIHRTVEQVNVILKPAVNWDAAVHRIVWRGVTWISDGPAKVRTRNGRAHHLTIPIKNA